MLNWRILDVYCTFRVCVLGPGWASLPMKEGGLSTPGSSVSTHPMARWLTKIHVTSSLASLPHHLHNETHLWHCYRPPHLQICWSKNRDVSSKDAKSGEFFTITTTWQINCWIHDFECNDKLKALECHANSPNPESILANSFIIIRSPLIINVCCSRAPYNYFSTNVMSEPTLPSKYLSG